MWILLAVALIPLAGLAYLACLDGRIRVRRGLEVEAPLEKVFAAVVDLETWPKWSPWLLHEPDADLEFSDDCRQEGGYYSWRGEIVGAGRITHLEIRPGSAVRQQIEFLKPFRSTSQVRWEFEKHEDRTAVTWEMIGKMPFLLRFMARRMEAMIGRDFDLGLAMLGGYLNGAKAHPSLEIAGPETLQGFSYWAIPCNGNLRQLEAARRGSIETLRASESARLGLSLTLYHRFDPLKANYQAEIAIPVSEHPPTSNYQQRRFDGGAYYRMTLRGDLGFLPLGWYALASHCRMRKIPVEAARPALEIYQQDPGTPVAENEAVTTLYLPIRDFQKG